MTVTEDRSQIRTYEQFIDGSWVGAADGATFERRSPYDGHVLATYPNSGVADAERALQAARRVFDAGEWPRTPAKQKAAILRKAAQLLMADMPELSAIVASEVGKPITMAQGEVAQGADVLEYYGAKAFDPHDGPSVTRQLDSAVGMVLREPIGVVSMITPWNFPLILVLWKAAPAIAAGCTMVLKPSHYTPGPALRLAKIFAEAGLPDGVFNVVTSETDNGALVGQHLAASELADKVAFTGSTATGKAIMRAAANNVKKVSLELGGKSPNIVFPDAQIDAALAGAFFGVYLNSGQVCQAGTRLLVANSIHDEFVDKLAGMSAGLKMGDPLDPSTTMGPLVNESQLRKVESYLEAGRSEAQLVTGGQRATGDGLDKGLFVQPTIFDNVPADAKIAREEIFGPVLSVLSFDDVDDVIRRANDTAYGLAAAVWTRDISVAFKVAKGLRAGSVWVNSYHSAGLYGMPFGGYKQSGIGRELGEEGLEEYLETKALQIKL